MWLKPTRRGSQLQHVASRCRLLLNHDLPLMAPPTDSAAAATAHSFNKILDRYKSASKARSATDMEEATKKLRRLILVDGIPSDVVCQCAHIRYDHCLRAQWGLRRTQRYDQGYGKYSCGSRTYRRSRFWSMSPAGLVRCERRSVTTRFGTHSFTLERALRLIYYQDARDGPRLQRARERRYAGTTPGRVCVAESW